MIDDETIRKLLLRLSRQNQSGGRVVERAAILAEGAESQSIVAWVLAHDGQPEVLAHAGGRGGLHGSRLNGDMNSSAPRRYVLPPGVLS